MTHREKADIINIAAADAADFLEKTAMQQCCTGCIREGKIKNIKKGIDKKILM